jgi:hypothetical protein
MLLRPKRDIGVSDGKQYKRRIAYERYQFKNAYNGRNRVSDSRSGVLLVFFLAAGTLSWFYSWIFLILFYSFSFGTVLWMFRHNPGLIKERAIGFKSNEPTWDKAYMALILTLFVIWLISMPLDAVRFHWSQMPTWLHVVGAIVFLCSFYLWYLTFREDLTCQERYASKKIEGKR